VVSHAKEAECQGFTARPTLASEAMPRWGRANVGETHFPLNLLIVDSVLVESGIGTVPFVFDASLLQYPPHVLASILFS